MLTPRFTLSLCAAAATGLSAAPAAAQVLVVDDDGGPGVDYVELQDAIDAAGPGATVLVKGGTYSPILIDGVSVTVVADHASVTVSGQSAIQNLSGNQSVVLNGIAFNDGFGTSLTLSGNAGAVWLEDVAVFSSGTPLFLPAEGMVIGSSDAVILSDCSIAAGAFSTGSTAAGTAGLSVSGSTLHMYDTAVSGGLTFEGFEGSPGVRASGATIFASGCTFTGGPGGDGDENLTPFMLCSDGEAGGPALELTFGPSDVTLLDTELVGGPGGAAGGPTCLPGSGGPGSVVSAGSSVAELGLTWPARSYDIPSPIRSGEVGNLEFSATPGELAWAVFSIGTAPVDFPLFNGSLALENPLIFAFVGQVPAGGTLSVPVNISLPPGVPYALAYEQGLFFSLEDEFVLGTPRAGWVLAAGL